MAWFAPMMPILGGIARQYGGQMLKLGAAGLIQGLSTIGSKFFAPRETDSPFTKLRNEVAMKAIKVGGDFLINKFVGNPKRVNPYTGNEEPLVLPTKRIQIMAPSAIDTNYHIDKHNNPGRGFLASRLTMRPPQVSAIPPLPFLAPG